MTDVRVLAAVRSLLMKAVRLIDTEIRKSEGKFDPCPHTEANEVTTMGKGPRKFICNDCGAHFEQEKEEHGQPETMVGSKWRQRSDVLTKPQPGVQS